MKIIIIGGGACGCICAIKLKKLNKDFDITILEQNDRILKKVLKTGNGKCNIMNNNIANSFYNDFSLFNNNVNVKSELEDCGLILKEISLGRMYPYNESSNSVVNVLKRNIDELGIKVITNYKVSSVKCIKDKYLINDELASDILVIATGSKAQEETNGYNILHNLNLKVTPLRPGLVPIITKEKTISMQNIKIKCSAKVNDYINNGEILFKDNGLSGILALDLSRYCMVNDIVCLDLAPEYDIESLKTIRSKFSSDNIFLESLLPKMVASDVLNRSKNSNIFDVLKNYTFTCAGFKDFKDAQITIGGLDLNEIDNNFEIKKYSNLYCGGEILNVDGACGGYNLYFAFMSGLSIANAIYTKM